MPKSNLAAKEQANTSLQNLSTHTNEILHGINAVDNLIPSLGANECRAWNASTNPFENGGVISHDLLFIGPIGLLLAGLSFGVEIWFQNRYRDDWEAYWALEEERFKKVEKALQQLPNNLSRSQKDVEQNAEIASPVEKHLEETYRLILWFEERIGHLDAIFDQTYTTQSEEAKKAYTEKRARLKKVSDRIARIKGQFGNWFTHEKLGQMEKVDDHAITRLQANFIGELSSPPKINNEKKSTWADAFTWIPDNGLFNVVFAYGWNYWGVFFVTLWGLPTPFAVVPLSWGLLALIAPVLYLFYREYKAHQEDRLALEADEEEIRQKGLDNDRVRLEYEKKHAERRNNLFPHRFLGWIFIGLVAALSVAVLCDFNFLIGGGVFLGVGLFGGAVAMLCDRHFRRTHLEAKISQHLSRTDEAPSSRDPNLLSRKIEARLHRLSQGYMRLLARKAQLDYALSQVEQPALRSTASEVKVDQKVTESSDSELIPVDREARHKTTIEKARKIISPVINFFLGYMIGIIVGFPSLDFLSHFMGATATGVTANAIVGVIGLVMGISFAARASNADRAHRKELKAERNKNDYCAKQDKVDFLNTRIVEKREMLKWRINHTRWLKGYSEPESDKNRLDEQCREKLALIEAPKKRLNKNKVLKFIRKGLNVLVNISSAMLMSRALFVMGFAAMFAFANNSIAVIGFNLMNPFGIAVFSVAFVFLVIKAANEMYLNLEKGKELKKVQFVDLELDRAKGEYEHLHKVEQLLNKEEAPLKPEVLVPVPVPTWDLTFRDLFYPKPAEPLLTDSEIKARTSTPGD